MFSFRKLGSVLVLLACISCTDDSEPTSAESGGAAAVQSDTAGRGGTGSPSGTAGRGTTPAAGRGAAGNPATPATTAGRGGSPNTDKDSEDAGQEPDDTDAAVSCEGEIVASRDRCLQDDAFCYPLGDGRYCTGPQAPECPRHSKPIAKDIPCPERTRCWDYSESLRCASRLYTPDECAADGGVALPDPGDGSLVCPNDAVALGDIDGAGWDEGGLCCPAPTTAAKQCGARAGDTCTAAEYCAYEAGQLCGRADAQATCKPRPSSCSGPSAEVCGCDQQTYSSACEANAAGVGIFAEEACE